MSNGDDLMAVSAPAKTESQTDDAKKRHLNLVFIGHRDAGKSTIGGQILSLSNPVNERTIQIDDKEAVDFGRNSWYLAHIMDTLDLESVEGITDESGSALSKTQTRITDLDAPGRTTYEVRRAHFETQRTRFTFLDAPGHTGYIQNMISGASQADIGVLVISAQKGEFGPGYRQGETREHIQLAKAMGVTKLLVVVNKMDDDSVNWSIERYNEIESKLTPLLKSLGYSVKQDVQFLPISGLQGSNLLTRVSKNVCSWWNGVCLLEALDSVDVPPCDPKAPFRLPIIDRFRSSCTVVIGKAESGSVNVGDELIIMPNKACVKVRALYCDEDEVSHAGPARPVPVVTSFVAQLQFLEVPDNAIYTAGYRAVLHNHSVVEECEIVELMKQIDLETKKPLKKKVIFVKNDTIVLCRIQVTNLTCIEKFADCPQLGQFTLPALKVKQLQSGK